MTQRNRTRVIGGFLTTGPAMAMDSASRFRDDDEEEPETVEIHNHVSDPDYGSLTSEEMDRRPRDLRDRRLRDDEPEIEEPDEEGELVEVLPEDLYARETQDGRTAIYRRRRGRHDSHVHTAEQENLAFDRRRKHVARDQRPPQTLSELNALHRQFYAKSHAVR